MQFVDEADIEVIAGHGGRGRVSFRKEAHVPFGGPSGGDGGRGGDVVAVASDSVATLLDHRYKRHYRAEDGENGGTSRCTGADAPDVVIPVPVGTQVKDARTGALLGDLDTAGKRLVLARGGRGGLGNQHFATSTRQAPRHAQPGEPGDHRTLHLDLKLMADVGVIGLPNAGKSTLLRALTASQARVGAYPFTTLVPNLGVYRGFERDIVLADIPGLVEGAHEGAGLGDRFLKHVERTRVLIHLVSLATDAADPLAAWRIVRAELAAWSPALAAFPEVVAINKIDTVDDPAELALWRAEFTALGVPVLFVSGHAHLGLKELMAAVYPYLAATVSEEPETDVLGRPQPAVWSPL
jgi:GTP-binding protein